MTGQAEELVRLGAATAHEVLGRRGWLGPQIVALWPGARVAGPCRTVWTPPGDNLGVHLALEDADPGEVLCVAVGGVWSFGGWGEVLMRAARARGVAGLITSGGVRDLDALERAAFPVFARGRATHGTIKRSRGRRQVPVAMGAGVIRPGDWVVADADGVVALPAQQLADVLRDGRARVAAEDAAMAAIDRGASSRAALGMAT